MNKIIGIGVVLMLVVVLCGCTDGEYVDYVLENTKKSKYGVITSVNYIEPNTNKQFWEKPTERTDIVFDNGRDTLSINAHNDHKDKAITIYSAFILAEQNIGIYCEVVYGTLPNDLGADLCVLMEIIPY